MSKIIEIEGDLKRMNGDNFQEFCNHYLFYKINPDSIDPIVSIIGKKKSRKGIPDSYLTTKSGELIFKRINCILAGFKSRFSMGGSHCNDHCGISPIFSGPSAWWMAIFFIKNYLNRLLQSFAFL